ncbi:efflux RND transporter periplasmic adaptor subunit [Planctobacterium marinum]|uniref:efflux RND transporter periplasmic adaptor subunit n=1 Tax=Planctobacterium marinum TaxID=1631968 RepID=UPI001E307AA8|nr:HlyD family efflux transporter periplasmic adaptor subunit [Planctobacterium marinum]MCC2607754.1 HlyD family efflux transporter periplasmic adaptor subunit [Planctobacterium marinum]
MLHEKQLLNELGFLKQRIEKLKAVNKEALNIENEKVNQLQSNLEIAQQRVDALEIKAGIAGVVQRVAVEIGQAVDAGQEVALIGSVDHLNAEVKVPQSKAELIRVGQKVLIDTRSTTMEGTVARIDPVVTENTVLVEVALPGDLPDSVRPQLSIDGKIIIDVLHDTLYVKRPSNVKANTYKNIFVLNEGGNEAELVAMQFGQEAGMFIQVTSGVPEQSKLVLNDLSRVGDKITRLAVN